MSRILTLDTYEQLTALNESYDKENTAALTQLEDRVEAIEKGYPDEHWDQFFARAGPDEMHDPFRNSGRDLEFTALINLQTESLSFLRGIKSYTLILSMPRHNAEHLLSYGNYWSMAGLAHGTEESIAKAENRFYGTKIKPVFYTLTQEALSQVMGTQEQPTEELFSKEDLRKMSLVERAQIKLGLCLMKNVRLDALAEKEREQFETIYSPEEDIK